MTGSFSYQFLMDCGTKVGPRESLFQPKKNSSCCCLAKETEKSVFIERNKRTRWLKNRLENRIYFSSDCSADFLDFFQIQIKEKLISNRGKRTFHLSSKKKYSKPHVHHSRVFEWVQCKGDIQALNDNCALVDEGMDAVVSMAHRMVAEMHHMESAALERYVHTSNTALRNLQDFVNLFDSCTKKKKRKLRIAPARQLRKTCMQAKDWPIHFNSIQTSP